MNKAEMVRDVLLFARDRRSIYDYRQFTLRSRGAGTSARDRQRVLEDLISNGTIAMEGEKLRINRSADWGWADQSLLAGNQKIWSVVDDFAPSKVASAIDDRILAEIGARGELAVVDELQLRLADSDFSRVKHVSLLDDSLGYDIVAPAISDPSVLRMLEVKTTTRPSGEFRFFLSRNESLKGLAQALWCLVFVRIEDAKPKILGHLSMGYFRDDLPRQVSSSVRADGYEIFVDVDQIIPGLP